MLSYVIRIRNFLTGDGEARFQCWLIPSHFNFLLKMQCCNSTQSWKIIRLSFMTVHVLYDLDILKYHRHFPLSQILLNFHTALKNVLLQE